MAQVGPQRDRFPLRKTPLCADEPSIIDQGTIDEIRNTYTDLHHELAGDVLYRKFNQATVKQDPYGESTQKLFLADVALKAKIEVNPSPQQITAHGLKEMVDAIFIFSEKDLEDASVVITTDDRFEFSGDVYNVHHVNPDIFIQNDILRRIIGLKIHSRQAPATPL